MGEALRNQPAPYLGLAAVFIRALLDAFLLYLPLSLMGRQPAAASYLTFIPSESYYAVSVGMMPVFLLGQWLLLGAVVHLVLRLLGRPGGFDQILNITGMAGLIVGAFLVAWDWLWIALGLGNDIALGISHLVIDIWAIAIMVAAYRSLLGVPVRLGIVLNVLYLVIYVPLAMIFVRAPV